MRRHAMKREEPMITRINSFASLCMLLAVLTAMEAAAQTTLQAQSIEMAALQTHLAWQRTSPTAQHPDGPVLYQIIFRSSATRGAIPKISNTFTLTNSLMSESGSTVIINGTANMTGFQLTTGGAVGKVLTSDASGNGTWQTPAGGGGGTVTSVGLSAPGSDFSVTNSPVTGSGILTLNWITSPTSANTANAIVKRDANGNFSAAAINASSTITSLNAAVSNVAVFGRSSATSGFGIGVEEEGDTASGAP